MDSDSDSDASHVSTTPPRCPPPPPPPQQLPPPPPRRPLLPSFEKSRIRVRPSSKPTSKPKKIIKPPTNPDPEPSQQKDPSPNPFPLPTLPFPTNLSFNQSTAISAADSIGTLPAGYFYKVSRFSKIRKPSLNFDPVEDASLPTSSSVSEIKTENPNIGGETVNLAKFVKKKHHPNLIGLNVPVPPVKLRKSGNEGNFVKLNMNGYKRKFTKKGKRKSNYASNSRRSYTRSKKKFKPAGEAENESFCDEDELIMETGSGRENLDSELIEEAVLVAQNEQSDENLLKLMKVMYGYDSFRDGQLEAINMVLAGKSTMLVLPTGAGKSLCYQIPAVIFPGITLVVSPLVALMIDQLKRLPPLIKGGLLCSSQTAEEVSETLRMLQEGTIKVLFVSPERFLNEEFLSTFSGTLAISLVVVDEAHCISEWSHNFRPSYMRLRASLLRSKLNAESILAMTATATTTTLHAVMSLLDIPPANLIQKDHLRDNLQLSVSLSGNRMKDLLMLIKSSPFTEVRSCIIYCKFQSETDLLSRYLTDNDISAKSYHSGIPAKDRSRIQELFCSNKIRVVVATVAFGMGLDKSDVGAVIHYSLPESLEEYVQETGRAGRDGGLAYCHLFYDDITYFKLRSLMYSDGVDEFAVNKFLCQIFSIDLKTPGKICSIVKESASHKLDMKEEVMLTLLTQLELGDVQYLRLLPQQHVTCTLNFHNTPPGLLADKNFVVAAVLKKSEIKQGQYLFNIPTVANSIGVTAIDLSKQLQNLKLKGEITYELKNPAYCYTIVKVPGDFCSLSADLTKWLSEVERCKVRKLDAMYNAAVFAKNACEKMDGYCGHQHTSCLQKKILDYFKGDDNCDVPNKMSQRSSFLRADVKVFLQSNQQAKFTPRAVARIMHGIASPAYPSMTWGRYTQVDFHVVMEAAKAELMNFVGKDAL